MNISRMMAKTSKFVADNSPLILTAMGVTGTLTTAYLTGKATFAAADKIEAEELIKNRKLSTKEKAKLVWPLYIPPAVTAFSTCTFIITANRIGTRRTAALASAYALSERAFEEYKDKVVEKIGEKKEDEIRSEIAQDRINRLDDSRIVVYTDTEKMLCLDTFSNQVFYSDIETIRRAENDINAQILHSDYATVSDFYSQIAAEDLNDTSVSGEMGWNTDKRLEVHYSSCLYKDKTPCLVIDYATLPIREPWRFV